MLTINNGQRARVQTRLEILSRSLPMAHVHLLHLPSPLGFDEFLLLSKGASPFAVAPLVALMAKPLAISLVLFNLICKE